MGFDGRLWEWALLIAASATLLAVLAWRKGRPPAHWAAMAAGLLFGPAGLVFPLAALVALSFLGWQCPLCARTLSRAEWRSSRSWRKRPSAEPGTCPRCGADAAQRDH